MSLSQHKWVKKQSLRGKSVEELRAELRKLKDDEFNLRFQRSTGKLENYRAIPISRKQRAILLTLIAEKQVEEGKK